MPTTHFHIRWSNSKLDWQSFPTEEEAIAEAERLKGSNETYLIEPHNEAECLCCSDIRLKA